MPSIDQIHVKAKRAIVAGETHFKQAADYLAEARKLGASQRQSAAAVGKSPAWVNQLLQWRDGGHKQTPFGPQSKIKRANAVQATERRARLERSHTNAVTLTPAPEPKTEYQIEKWKAQSTRAEAVIQMFGAPISDGIRAKLVAALEALPADHPIERLRARVGLTWHQLIVAAKAEASKAA